MLQVGRFTTVTRPELLYFKSQHRTPEPMTTTTATNAFEASLFAVQEALQGCDPAIDHAFKGETFDVRIDRAIMQAKIAKRAADDAAQYLAQVRAEILSLMEGSDLKTFESDFGKVTVCKGRRTVSVTDKALAAEISLIKERGVRTGRCAEKQGDPYIVIK